MNARLLLMVSTVAVVGRLAAGAPQTWVAPHEPLPSSWQIHPTASTQFDIPPKLVRSEAPIYPITQLRQHKSGSAVIEFMIDQRGDTRDFKVISADYPYYASHAIVAVRKWKFSPGLKNGRPVAVRVRVPFDYHVR